MSDNISSNKKGSVVIVGGGIGGMQAALDLANSQFKVHLIQKDTSIGGTMVMLDKTFPTGDCSICMISPKMVEVGRHLNIDLHLRSEVISVDGQPGDFRIKVKHAARYVDPDKCTGCGDCEAKCPKNFLTNLNRDWQSANVSIPCLLRLCPIRGLSMRSTAFT